MRLEEDLFPPHRIASLTRGLPSSLDRRDKIGLYLIFVGSRMQIKYLCLILVLSHICSEYITEMMRIVCKRLKRNKYAKIKFPTEEEKRDYASIVEAREPLVTNFVGNVRGRTFPKYSPFPA